MDTKLCTNDPVGHSAVHKMTRWDTQLRTNDPVGHSAVHK